MIGVQAEGSSPVVKAYKEGTRKITVIEPNTIADSISVGHPRDGYKALRAIEESNGMMIAVSDESILNAIKLLARGSGVFAEPAGSTAYAGLLKAIDENKLKEDQSILVMITGNGLKDISGAKKAVKRKPIKTEPNMDSVREVISKLDIKNIF